MENRYFCHMDNLFQKYFTFLNVLKTNLLNPLPGINAHQRLEPVSRKRYNPFPDPLKPPRESAVLILIFPENGGLSTAFIKRNEYDGVHSGQIAFPGGKMELTDESLSHTAIREAYEEIGITPTDIQVIGYLSSIYIPPSNFNVQPVIGWLPYTPEFKIDTSEVSMAFSVPLKELFSGNNIHKETISFRDGFNIEVPCYILQNQIIWGATSMILSEFIEVVEISEINKYL
jgi:8-oxo-dGTP pyrophosphatase MutT (NUDIX family)